MKAAVTKCAVVPGLWWISLPPSDEVLRSYHLMLAVRKAVPGLIVNTVGNNFLYFMRSWP